MTPSIRNCTVLIVDIAGSVALRAQVGEAEAGQRIRELLQDLARIVRANGCTFLKSYGDDLIATFEGPDMGAALACESAIAAQRRADVLGLQLYAGLCAGPVEFVESMGHPDCYGQAMNLAARLHKLIEDLPGRIFLPAELVQQLPADLQKESSLFSTHQIKGYGPMEVWTLSWRDHASTVTYVPPKTPGVDALPLRAGPLALWHRGKRMDIAPDSSEPFVIGRAPSCSLTVADPEPRISSKHLVIGIESGLWMARDVSRNGCWVRDERTGEEFALLPGAKARLPGRGVMCLGRSFTEDPVNAYVVYFEAALRALRALRV